MAKICAGCGKEMGMFNGKVQVRDNECFCNSCWEKAGFNTWGDLMDKPQMYTSKDIIEMIKGNKTHDALKKSMETPQTTAPVSSHPSGISGKVVGIIVAISLILVCWFIGTTSDNSDKTNTRTCAWCNGTGYSASGAQSPEDYVFKKTPCTHCGGDGKY